MLLLFLGKLQYLKITQPFTAIPENVSHIILEGTMVNSRFEAHLNSDFLSMTYVT